MLNDRVPDLPTAQVLIEEYFGQCVKLAQAPNLPGLAYHLKFSSVAEFDKAAEKPDYQYDLNRARLRIEAYINNQVLTKANPAGGTFLAKSQYKYDDKGTGQGTHVTINLEGVATRL
jgi:hypothetical protein